MPDLPTVLVVCTANVCRSVYAASMLHTLLGDLGIRVVSAGLAASPGMPACPLVAERVLATGERLDRHAARRLLPEDLRSSSLVLTMTTSQRGDANRLLWDGRDRAFTLIEAAAIATVVRQPGDFESFVTALANRRSTVPMPADKAGVRTWLRQSSPGMMIDIADGHTSRWQRDHLATLDRVHQEVTQLATAMRAVLRPS